VKNEYEYVTKMAQSATMGHLWGDLITMFWMTKYLQRPIYVWNKISKCIMSRCGIDFQSIPLLITYNSQHFELIEYENGVLRFLHAFEPNDPKVTTNLDEFPLIS
jgi:hypothetical protein